MIEIGDLLIENMNVGYVLNKDYKNLFIKWTLPFNVVSFTTLEKTTFDVAEAWIGAKRFKHIKHK